LGKLWYQYGMLIMLYLAVKFDLEDEEQVKICFNWSNVQPLLANHNLSKNDSLYWIELNEP
jgi:hypothetical protein